MPTPAESGRTELLPLFPLGTVLVPGMPLALHVFEPRYRQLVADLLNEQDPAAPVFGVVALRSGWEVGQLGELHAIGTTARVTDVLPHPDGRCDLAAVGERRFTLVGIDDVSKPYLVARVRYLPEDAEPPTESAAEGVRMWLRIHRATLAAIGVGYGGPGGSDSDPTVADAKAGPVELSYRVAQQPSLPMADRQALLACADTNARLAAARSILRRETELLRQLRAIPASAGMFTAGLGSS